MRHFFTGDEHFDHFNIIKYCHRPFQTAQEMNEAIITNYNSVVGPDDIVVHVGDFTFRDSEQFIKRLHGKHLFLKGNHDKWQGQGKYPDMLELTIEGQHIVACHYAMRVWNRSHFNAWQIYGHSHGTLPPIGKQWDVGVDNNNFFPVSFEQLREIMNKQPDNPNFIKKRDRR
jgi:calcineurin-like phosphoesterase family protein